MSLKIDSLYGSIQHKSLSGRLSPSGRFSLVQLFPSKKKTASHEKIQKQTDTPLLTVQQLDDNYAAIMAGGIPSLPDVLPPDRQSGATLGLSIANNSRTRSARGSGGIRPRQRDVLCWSANQLERVYGRKCMSFLTLTLPTMPDCDLRSIQDNWSKIVDEVCREIKRKLRDAGLRTSVVGCTEIQLERREETGQSYPHLHLVFRGRVSTVYAWLLTPSQFRAIWQTACSRFLGSSAYQWESSENVQQVRSSSGGYLAKYISKCSSKSELGTQNSWHPGDWIVCSRVLRSLYRQLTVSGYDIGIALLDVVMNWVPDNGYKKDIMIRRKMSEGKIVKGKYTYSEWVDEKKIGVWGWLKNESKMLTPAEWFSQVEYVY